MSLQLLLPDLADSSELGALQEAVASPQGTAWVSGLTGSARAVVAAALLQDPARSLLWITPDEESAERTVDDLRAFGFSEADAALYPVSPIELDLPTAEVSSAASSVDPELRALARRRLSVLQSLSERQTRVVVAPIAAALRQTLAPGSVLSLVLHPRDQIETRDLSIRLVKLGYERLPMVERPGHFAVRGGLVDIWPSTADQPFRLEFDDDVIESVRLVNPETQRSVGEQPKLVIPAASDRPREGDEPALILDHLPEDRLVLVEEPSHLRAHWLQRLEQQRPGRAADADTPEVRAGATGTWITLDEFEHMLESQRVVCMTLLAQSLGWLKPLQERAVRVAITSAAVEPARGNVEELTKRIRSWMASGSRAWIASDQAHRLQQVLAEFDLASEVVDDEGAAVPEDPRVVRLVHGRLSAGFRIPGAHVAVLSDADIYGDPSRRRATGRGPDHRRFKDSRPILSFTELREGDLVVHVTHGIGVYRGLEQRNVGGVTREFVRIDYRAPDRLFVPSEQLDRVQKYIGSGDNKPSLHRLGGVEWARTKSKVRAKVKDLAVELVALYARRQAATGHAFAPDTVWQEEMESAFPYRETRDQMRAIRETKRDMEKPSPMDRLVCGDVGYGKTEVAVRAAFKAVTDGKQVALLAPTTILAQQHFNTFSERLAAYPIKVELLSRFRSKTEIKAALEGLRTNQVDIVVGTHRLLSKDVRFSNLGLLVVDEEQRFGVGHKERVKQMRASVDVLTLTATPIPRTLHMSLAGIRDMSVIEEPPEGRLAVRTFCMPEDGDTIRDAILLELDRGGQVYFIHNRIESIYRVADELKSLVPQARIRIGHGQMGESDLEDVMLSFYEGEFDVLLCTTIIENGLDVPNANTLIVQNSDRFGLSQLHQLRGRVGRSALQAYCYLFYRPNKELSEEAEQRLQALRDFTELGAGFKIAMRDMEIRGAGNLLGAEQSGNMISVGFDLYCQMIDQAVKELKGEESDELLVPSVSLPVNAYIPTDYIPTEGLRIAFYKKIASCRTLDEVAEVQDELDDRFGDPPEPVWTLLAVMRLRINCIAAGVARIETERGAVVIWMARRIDKEEQKLIYRQNRRVQFFTDRMVLHFDSGKPLRPVENMVKLLRREASVAAEASVQRQLAAAEAAAGK